jgi:hypothetical protein
LTNVLFLTRGTSAYDAVTNYLKVEDRCILQWILKKECMRKWAGFVLLEQSVVAVHVQMIMKLQTP